jgi:hypothetical protein
MTEMLYSRRLYQPYNDELGGEQGKGVENILDLRWRDQYPGFIYRSESEGFRAWLLDDVESIVKDPGF